MRYTVGQLLLQEYYRGQSLAPHPNDQAHALLRTLLYDEAWRLGIEPQSA